MSDCRDLDFVLHELYAGISGPAGPRSLEREQRLFHPAGRLMRTGVDESGRPWIRVMTPAEWHADTAEFFASEDFHEMEVARRVERFGNIAWARSVYECRRNPSDPEILKRGVNSIQLYHDGERWWVLSILWDNERDGLTLPEEWLALSP